MILQETTIENCWKCLRYTRYAAGKNHVKLEIITLPTTCLQVGPLSKKNKRNRSTEPILWLELTIYETGEKQKCQCRVPVGHVPVNLDASLVDRRLREGPWFWCDAKVFLFLTTHCPGVTGKYKQNQTNIYKNIQDDSSDIDSLGHGGATWNRTKHQKPFAVSVRTCPLPGDVAFHKLRSCKQLPKMCMDRLIVANSRACWGEICGPVITSPEYTAWPAVDMGHISPSPFPVMQVILNIIESWDPPKESRHY